MKKVLLGTLALATLAANAYHVEDRDKFINIGKIKQITFTQTLNLKPNTSRTKIGNTRCYLEHNSVNFDRSLTAPKTFKHVMIYKSVNPYRINDRIGFQFEGLNAANKVYCENDHDLRNVTIGQMKRYFKNSLEFILGDTVEID